MKFDSVSMAEAQQYFPSLSLIGNSVCGEIEFFAKYVQTSRGQFVVEPCESGNGDCVRGKYKIQILLDDLGMPRVFEVGGKVQSVALKLKIKLIDLHINRDDSCCLDFCLNIRQNLTLNEFVLQKVYPFFVWQAYYEKFKVLPPVGEYSHGRDDAINEFCKDLLGSERNDLCICGSGKKFKKCCLRRLQGN